jgi:hypothetical protein
VLSPPAQRQVPVWVAGEGVAGTTQAALSPGRTTGHTSDSEGRVPNPQVLVAITLHPSLCHLFPAVQASLQVHVGVITEPSWEYAGAPDPSGDHVHGVGPLSRWLPAAPTPGVCRERK